MDHGEVFTNEREVNAMLDRWLPNASALKAASLSPPAAM